MAKEDKDQHTKQVKCNRRTLSNVTNSSKCGCSNDRNAFVYVFFFNYINEMKMVIWLATQDWKAPCNHEI